MWRMPHSRSLSISAGEAFQNEVVLLQQLRDRDSVIQVLNLRMLWAVTMKKCKDGFLEVQNDGETRTNKRFVFDLYIYTFIYLFIHWFMLTFFNLYICPSNSDSLTSWSCFHNQSFSRWVHPGRYSLHGRAMENVIQYECVNWVHTVDGSEIRRSPVEVGSFIPVFAGFYIHPRWFSCRMSAINSTVELCEPILFWTGNASSLCCDNYPSIEADKVVFNESGFFSAPIIFNDHHKYGHSIIGICLWWSVWWWNAGNVNLPPVQDFFHRVRIVGCECQMSMSLERQC